MIKKLQRHINQYVRIHYAVDQSFSGYLDEVDVAEDVAVLYNEAGKATIYARISTATAATFVQEREPTEPSPHYETQRACNTAYPPQQNRFPVATNARLSNSAYRRNHAQS